MMTRTERILTAEEVSYILSTHFGLPPEECVLLYEGGAPTRFFLRRDEKDQKVVDE